MADDLAAVQRTLRALTRAATAAHAQGDRAATRTTGHGLARWQALDCFADARRTVPTAARLLRQSRQSLQRIVDVLEGEGHLERRPNPDHRSSPLFEPTPSGRALLRRLDDSVAEWTSFVAARMSTAELEQLTALLNRVRELADGYDER